MITNFKNASMQKFFALSLLFAFMMMTNACKKVTPEELVPQEIPVVYSYEVSCDYCNITYIDVTNQTKTLKNNIGKWSYKVESKSAINLLLSIKTSLANSQSIQAYILKDGEVIYGSMGYNLAEIVYNISSGNGTSVFGNYVSTSTGSGSGSGGTTAPSSSVCGARNKTGGNCKRVVVGGGRCWQHR